MEVPTNESFQYFVKLMTSVPISVRMESPIFPENSSPNAFPFTSMSDMTNVSLDEISIVKPTGVSSKWR